jgi:hypothetical protein
MKRVRILGRPQWDTPRGILFLTTIVCLLFLVMGCQPSGTEAEVQVKPEERTPPVATSPRHGGKIAEEVVKPEAEQPPQPSAKAEPAVELGLKFSQGDSATYKVTTEAQRKIKGEGALLEDSKFRGGTTSSKAEIIFTQQIQSVDAQGNAAAKITIDELKYLAKVKNNITNDFDSSREKDQINPFYKLIGQSYTIEITPAGEVSKIIDASRAQAAVSGNSHTRQIASMLLNSNAIKQRHTIPALPTADKNLLRAGDSWSNTKPFSFGMMGSKSYERIYTLKEIEQVDNHRTALVEMKAIPSAEMTEEMVQEQGMGIFSKMFDNKEAYTGELKLDLNTGRVKEYSENLESEWIAVDPQAGPETDGEPARLRMTATRFYHIEKVD